MRIPTFLGLRVECLTQKPESKKNTVIAVHEHGTRSHLVTTTDNTHPQCDILATAMKNITLVHGYADCVPLIIYDESKHAVVFAHAGWRGLTKGVVDTCIFLAQEAFGSKAQDLDVWIGPCIHKESYCSADTPVQIDDPSWQKYISKEHDGYHIDFPGFIAARCAELGIHPSQIAIDPQNTYTSSLLPSFTRYKQSGSVGRFSNFYISCTLT